MRATPVGILMTAMLEGGRSPRTVSLESGETGCVGPIHVGPICLSCHGADVDPSVKDQRQKLYPEDEATGFREGDFRGVFWVVMSGKEGP